MGLFLCGLACAFGPLAPAADGSDETVAVRYHFAGAAHLAANTNFALAKRLLSLPSSVEFRNLVLDRLAGVFWRDLQFEKAGDPVAGLRPLLDDLLTVESVASFGGASKDRMSFVLAAHLDKARTQAWQQSLGAALGGKGEPFAAEGFSGTRWNRPGKNVFWMLPARDWIVAGQGDDLQAVRTDYLQQIQKNGRPWPALKETWLQADVNWPRLAAWVPLESCPFKLARTTLDVTSGHGRFHLTGFITYPGPVLWEAAPWRFPKDMVHEPLVSFTAGRDVAPFLKPDATLPRLCAKAFGDQFCCWAQGEMPFQSYAAWPVANGREAMNKLAGESLPELNSVLTQPGEAKLTWQANRSEIVWAKSSIMAPALSPTHEKTGDYLLAGLFPLSERNAPPPASLWRQFERRDDLVYYDWEFTGPRLQQWRLLCELLPVLPPVADASASAAAAGGRKAPLVIVDGWLAGLTPFLDNTVTEITRTSPGELSVARTTPFVLTSYELLWLSHWLTETPSGPVNYNLLPRAKMSGPGLPSR
jgi:hypothetical protein